MKIIQRYKEISMHRKNFDIVTNNIHYPIASFLCTLISFSRITPNMVTVIAILTELGAIWLIWVNLIEYRIIIVLLFQLGWIFDLMDGMLARYKKMGFYHPQNPSIKGFYLDAVSDHVLNFITIGTLAYYLSLYSDNGWILGLFGIIVHAVVQTEHTLRESILKSIKNQKKQSEDKSPSIYNNAALLMNNIYLYYLIFILINRVDLFFIFFASGEIILFFKRIFKFWQTEH